MANNKSEGDLMRTIGYLLLLLSIFLSSGACKNSNSNDSSIPEKEFVEINTKEPTVDEVKIEIEQKPTKTKDNINSLIPTGWGILIKDDPVIAEGDLNKDGIMDVATIIEQLDSGTDETPQRALLIAFGTMENSFLLSIIADKVILKADEGGIWGDPFESLSIERGSVVVSEYGGSNWRWYNKFRFRYQDNDWYLIGATMGEYFAGNATQEEASEEDYNLLTGDFIIKQTNEDGETTTERGNRGKRELVRLEDFSLENM